LRYGSPKDSELIARRVARIGFGLYASPTYRGKLDAGAAPAFIGFDEENDFIAEAGGWRASLATGDFLSHCQPDDAGRRSARGLRRRAAPAIWRPTIRAWCGSRLEHVCRARRVAPDPARP